MCSDQDLMAKVQAGDPEAFGVLAQRHKEWLTRLLYHLFWNREEAEDGAQEVLLRLWLARRTYQATANLRTFLFTIARNYWHNRSTRVIRRSPVVSLEDQFGPNARRVIEALADESPTPEHLILQRLEQHRLRQAINQLPEKQRLVLVMSHFLDMRYAEIGETLGIPEGTVKSRMATAVQSLRRVLG
jgi:RNA polymerase sigma-70 factor, ECF subfamily